MMLQSDMDDISVKVLQYFRRMHDYNLMYTSFKFSLPPYKILIFQLTKTRVEHWSVVTAALSHGETRAEFTF